MSKAYYTLSWGRSGRWYEKKEQLSASADTIRIGQQAGCDVRLGNEGVYADEVFAQIRPDTPEGWLLIPVSEYVSCFVNGSPVSLVHHLQNGDRIHFSETDYEFLFEIRQDGSFVREGVQRSSSLPLPLRILLAALLFVLLGFLSFRVIRSGRENAVREKALAAVRPSVLQIKVDSVFLVCSTAGTDRIVQAFSYVRDEGVSINGTAFLTRDSLFVTARHCIEPWLNDISILRSNPALSRYSVPVQWALEAETYNQTHSEDTVYKVISKCTFAGGEDASEPLETSFLSSDFVYDTSRDEVVELGSFSREYYWRSITGRFARRDMMLDDIAYAHAPLAGSIRLASAEKLPELLVQGTSLVFMGYPEYQTAGFEQSEGTVRRNYSAGDMIVHNGQLLHGYSGGPVFVVSGSAVTAVGVISVLDNSGGSRVYSVPVSEMKKEGKDE